MTGEGEGQPFFCFRFNFRAITRLETLATQAILMTELRAGLTTVCDAVELLSLISSQIHLYKLFQTCFSVAAQLNHGKKIIFGLDSRLARAWLVA